MTARMRKLIRLRWTHMSEGTFSHDTAQNSPVLNGFVDIW